MVVGLLSMAAVGEPLPISSPSTSPVRLPADSLTTLDLIHAFATTLNASEIYALATSDDGNDLLAVPHAGKVLIGDCASGSTLVTVATSSSGASAANDGLVAARGGRLDHHPPFSRPLRLGGSGGTLSGWIDPGQCVGSRFGATNLSSAVRRTARCLSKGPPPAPHPLTCLWVRQCGSICYPDVRQRRHSHL